MHIADLIEKECATISLLEFSDAGLKGAGEGTAFMPEQLALQQIFRQGCAVYLDERLVSPVADKLDQAGDQLFAGPGLSLDQNRGVALGHFLDQGKNLLDLRAPAHQRIMIIKPEILAVARVNILRHLFEVDLAVVLCSRVGCHVLCFSRYVSNRISKIDTRLKILNKIVIAEKLG